MGRISDDDVRRVREATDLVALVSERVVLRQKGRLFWGCCPFHNEKTPSFKIDPSTQLWHCFGCGKGGDVFGYLMESERLEFPDAVRVLAERANIEITETGGPSISRGVRERCMQACKAAEDFFHNELMRSKGTDAASARAYLHERGFGTAAAKNWRLGYAPGHGALTAHLKQLGFTRDELVQANLAYVSQKNGRLVDRFYARIMFPVHDLQGRTVAFGGRVIGTGEPKYLNTSETPVFHKSSNMFGIHNAKNAIVAANTAVVVEGYTDVIACHEAGVKNVVATLGTALTAQHVKMLSRFATKIVYLFDGDAAGQKAADRASEFIDWSSAVESSRNPTELLVAVLPNGMDPAEYLAAEGADALRRQIAAAQPLLRFSVIRCLERFDLSKPEEKARALEAALRILLPIKNSVSATDYVNLIADRLNVEYNSVSMALKEMKAPTAARRLENQEGNSEPHAHAFNAGVNKVLQADRCSVAMERQLVGLVVTDASLLDELERGLARIQWADAAAQAMVAGLLGLSHSASPSEALLAVQKGCPEAATLLSEVMVETDVRSEKLYRARILLNALRQRDLERAIRNVKQRLLDTGSLEADAVDELYKKAASMQKELAELREKPHHAGIQ